MQTPITKLIKQYPKKQCPACGQRAGAHILYGYPAEDLSEPVRLGHVVLAGCVLPLAGEPDYRYQCKQCGHKWE